MMNKGRLSSRFRSYGFPCLIAVLGLLAFASWVFLFGRVEGLEFSPQTFQFRNFSYVEIPMVRIQVWPVQRTACPHEVADFLTTNGWIGPPSPSANATPVWHLVTVDRRGVVGSGDADLLKRILDLRDHRAGARWLQWTKDHEEQARRLWREVARLAQLELYFLIPELMNGAVSESSPVAFEHYLDRQLLRSLSTVAKTQHELGHGRNAIELYDEALRHAVAGSPDEESLRIERQKAAAFADAPVAAEGR